jgi:hypothetical protein
MKTRTKLVRRLIIYDLFNNTLSSSNYIPLDDTLSVNDVLDTMSENGKTGSIRLLVETEEYRKSDPSRLLVCWPKYEA